MTLLDRYIARALLGAVALVMAVLLVLGLLFTFIGEQGDIGTGHYGALNALKYSAMVLPQFALQAFPAATLIGALLGIGVLSRSHELTVMRVSGMSKLRLCAAVLMSAAVLAAVALAVGEILAPQLAQLANQSKAFAKYENVSFVGGGGAWIRDGNTILNIRPRSAAAQFDNMLVFELTDGNQLAAVARAERAERPRGGNGQLWQLSGYAESRFNGDQVSSTVAPQRTLRSINSADVLLLGQADTSELALRTLYRAMRYLRANGLQLQSYLFAFWARIARIAGIPAALLLALPFGFGSMRSAGAGARTALGLGVGVVYFFLQRMVESGAQVFNLSPLLLAWVPTALLTLSALIVLARAR
jgi:lipopolysaccharide export system permease protein